MKDLQAIERQNIQAVIREYREALLDGAYERAIAIREANPDIESIQSGHKPTNHFPGTWQTRRTGNAS
jgi:hypothetical protein